MDETLKRKLNMLIYLANVDGKFHKAERKLLNDFTKKYKVDSEEFKKLLKNPEEFETDEIIDQEQMLFLALKLINADNYLDEKEIAFCKEIAEKFGYSKQIVDVFNTKNLTKKEFTQELLKWKLS